MSVGGGGGGLGGRWAQDSSEGRQDKRFEDRPVIARRVAAARSAPTPLGNSSGNSTPKGAGTGCD